VLYPNDSTPDGKEMRLMQEYFMSSATLQDIVRRLKHQQKAEIGELPSLAAIQLNDTHPAVMVAELLRILIDEEGLPFDEAYAITRRVFSYTCHTLMPEALEKWPVPLFENLLPRHLQIIYELNHVFLSGVRAEFNPPDSVIAALSIVEESSPKQLRMANLAVIGSHTVNGVAAIHSDLMKLLVFRDFAALFPDKFQNKTNGVTIRRWLHHCNPLLSALITEAVGGSESWALHASQLTRLLDRLDDEAFCARWTAIKDGNKQRLTDYVQAHLGVVLRPEIQMFDIQVKRIHEYKRQTINVFSIIYRYLTILDSSDRDRGQMTPRASIIGGKSAPGYYAAKKLIKLVNNVGRVVNSDAVVGDLLKVVFIPNYNVTIAEMIIPASDINQQISTAGTEASGTSNMKFAFNGSLIVGTWDGANIEIGDAIGEENVFFFGAKAHEVDALRATAGGREIDPRLRRVFQAIRAGVFGDPHEYECLMWPIEHGDPYLVAYDWPLYLDAQAAVDAAYRDQSRWIRMSISSTANMAGFSSDRTITEYAEHIWGITPHPVPPTTPGGILEAPPKSGPGSLGSLRRQAIAAIPVSRNADGPAAPVKGSFGSLTRRAAPAGARAPPLPPARPEDEVVIDL
jgi:starch phosphorylase